MQAEELREFEEKFVTKEQLLLELVEELRGKGPEVRAQLSRLEMFAVGSRPRRRSRRGRWRRGKERRKGRKGQKHVRVLDEAGCADTYAVPRTG